MQLSSFDLQTVEFAYAEGYSVAITCEDQLSKTSGAKFDLRFTRTRSPPDSETGNALNSSSAEEDTFNPHDDAEPFLSNILRHGQGKLAPSLERLIMVLRDTLPIVVELEKIRRACKDEGYYVDTYAKSAGWYRILYPTLRFVVFQSIHSVVPFRYTPIHAFLSPMSFLNPHSPAVSFALHFRHGFH